MRISPTAPHKRFNPLLDLVANLPSSSKPLFFAPCECRRISKSPMQPFARTRKHRTPLCSRLIANSDDNVESLPLPKELKDILRPVSGNVDPVLLHDRDGKGVQGAWLKASALGFKPVGCQMIEICLCHLATGAVVDADEQDLLWIHVCWLRLHRTHPLAPPLLPREGDGG